MIHTLPVNTEYVKIILEAIRSKAEGGQEDKAAFLERELFCDVLKSIAMGAHNPEELAAATIQTLNINFRRL